MVAGRTTLAFLCGLTLACGPGGTATPDTDGETDTDTDTDTEGDPTTTSTTNNTTTGMPTTTNASNEGSATTTGEDTGPLDTGNTDAATTDDCPLGTEGCLCDVGAACDDGLECNDDGICEAPPACRPIDEDPHDDEASAYELDPVGCGDGMDLGLVGTIEGIETDWYTFFGGESFMCIEQPTAITMPLGFTAQVCVYIECVEGTAAGVACGDGSSDAMSPEGRPGCCGDDAAQIADYDCMGQFAGKDVAVWVSVGSDEEVCNDYSLSYGM